MSFQREIVHEGWEIPDDVLPEDAEAEREWAYEAENKVVNDLDELSQSMIEMRMEFEQFSSRVWGMRDPEQYIQERIKIEVEEMERRMKRDLKEERRKIRRIMAMDERKWTMEKVAIEVARIRPSDDQLEEDRSYSSHDMARSQSGLSSSSSNDSFTIPPEKPEKILADILKLESSETDSGADDIVGELSLEGRSTKAVMNLLGVWGPTKSEATWKLVKSKNEVLGLAVPSAAQEERFKHLLK